MYFLEQIQSINLNIYKRGMSFERVVLFLACVHVKDLHLSFRLHLRAVGCHGATQEYP